MLWHVIYGGSLERLRLLPNAAAPNEINKAPRYQLLALSTGKADHGTEPDSNKGDVRSLSSEEAKEPKAVSSPTTLLASKIKLRA